LSSPAPRPLHSLPTRRSSDLYSKDAQFRRRFQREASAIANLNHPGIVRIYDFDEDNSSLFIVMEYVDGESLRSILQNKGRISVQDRKSTRLNSSHLVISYAVF